MNFNIKKHYKTCSIVFLSCLSILCFISCSGEDKSYGIVEMFHEKPKPPRIVPRMIIGGKDPSGIFGTHKITGIIVMDSGADYDLQDSMIYLNYLDERYEDKNGLGDLPFHYYIDPVGIIYKGRADNNPAELYEKDPFVYRSIEIEKKDLLISRLEHKRTDVLPMKLDGDRKSVV